MTQEEFINLWIKIGRPITTRYQAERAWSEIMHSEISLSGMITDIFSNVIDDKPVISVLFRIELSGGSRDRIFVQADFPFNSKVGNKNKYDLIDVTGKVYCLDLPNWRPEKVNLYINCRENGGYKDENNTRTNQ